MSETDASVVKLYRLIHIRFRRTTEHSVTSHDLKRSSSFPSHKKRPAFYGRLSRNLKLVLFLSWCRVPPGDSTQSVKTRAYLQTAVDWNALSHRKDSPQK